MAKVLLLNPSMAGIYEGTKVKHSVANYFPLNLLIVAMPLLKRGHEVKLVDFLVKPFNKEKFAKFLNTYKPEYVGITFTTPLYSEAMKIASFIKLHDPKIKIIAGGTHISSLPEQTLKDSEIDIAIVGEGDFTMVDIVEKAPLDKIKGIAYKKGKKITFTPKHELMKNLDETPFPALQLVNINDYVVPHTISRRNPVFPYETSRGCTYGCVYCNKSVFGRTFRAKSVNKVIEELKAIKRHGFQEVHIMDDGFTTDIKRAKEICRMIIKNKIGLLMNCLAGIRADYTDMELIKLMKKAGFYRVSLGIESGSQRIVNNLQKNMKLSDIERVVKMCKVAGIETLGFFMFGLPDETEKDMQKTIDFAKKLKPDVVKFDIMIPLPGTPVYNGWKSQGIIKSSNWDEYNFHSKKMVYNHPNMPWKTIFHYLHKSYREFYLSPSFLFRRLIYAIKNGTLVQDLTVFFKTKW
jgi:radical SAM superfamily enzyme YgiQ (UPF0313 family)